MPRRAQVDNGYVYERYWWDWIAANQLAFLASIIFYVRCCPLGRRRTRVSPT